jgi:LDH2 family malate/lactate/ureidoglycolate dehydrogenase
LGRADGFLAAVESWCVDVRVRAEAAGSQVTLPGEPEARARSERRQRGVPVPPSIWNSLLALRERLEGAVPAPLEAS